MFKNKKILLINKMKHFVKKRDNINGIGNTDYEGIKREHQPPYTDHMGMDYMGMDHMDHMGMDYHKKKSNHYGKNSSKGHSQEVIVVDPKIKISSGTTDNKYPALANAYRPCSYEIVKRACPM